MTTSPYAFDPLPERAVPSGAFPFAAVGLDHGHIEGMVEGLTAAGGTLTWVFDTDPNRAGALAEKYPTARVATSEQQVLGDEAVRLVATAAIPSERAAVGLRAIDAGKHAFVDKAPLTTFEQLAAVREATARTGLKYAVYYGERLHSEAAVLAGQLIARDAIGTVLNVASFGPHKIGTGRPDWFWDPAQYGGILCDIGSHNFDQMLVYTGAADGDVLSATVANRAHPETPAFEDHGDAHVRFDNGATGYVRVDWFTPDSLGVFGDGRTFILGTDGYIELRKYVDIGTDNGGGQLLLVNEHGQQRFDARGMTGFPYFGQLIRDCLEGTETAMTQAHALKAAELSLIAQSTAAASSPVRFRSGNPAPQAPQQRTESQRRDR